MSEAAQLEEGRPLAGPGVFAVAWQCDDGGQVLRHLVTGDELELPAEDGPWLLGLDDDDGADGAAYLVNRDGEPSWASDWFPNKVYDKGGTLIVKSQGIEQSLLDFGSVAEEHSITLHSSGLRSLIVDVHIFDRCFHGFRVWWSAPSLYLGLGLEGQPGEWYHNGWRRWENYLATWGILPIEPRLRRALVTAQSGATNRREVNHHFRCLQVYTMSSLALLSLCVRWARPAARAQHRTLAAENRRTGFTSLLSSLVTALGHAFDIVVAVDKPDDLNGEIEVDRLMVPISCQGGMMETSELASCPFLSSFEPFASLDGHDVNIAKFLVALDSSPADVCKRFFTNFAMVLAKRLDRQVLDKCDVAAIGDDIADRQVHGPADAEVAEGRPCRVGRHRKRDLAAHKEWKMRMQDTKLYCMGETVVPLP